MLINEAVKYNDPLSSVFAALADPTRRSILARLSKGDATVNELAEPFSMSLPAVSRHIKVLEKAGLISRGKKAQWRPCRLQATTLKQVIAWVGDYRDLWDENMDSLENFIKKNPEINK